MKKENMLWFILNSIFLILFNVAFFTISGFDHKASTWISYGFIHFAYAMLLLTPKLTRGEKSWTALGFPLYAISAIYFLTAFFAGIFFILISLDGYKITLLFQLFIAGFYGIVLVANMIANEYTGNAEEERQPQIAFIKNASAQLKGLLENIDDKETKKAVEKVYDAVYSSPVKSHPNLAQLENRILQSIKELEYIVSTGDNESIISQANLLLATVNEKNSRLKSGTP